MGKVREEEERELAKRKKSDQMRRMREEEGRELVKGRKGNQDEEDKKKKILAKERKGKSAGKGR